jgi:pimeloyl-ACP methyl ester carboxylesterase
MPTRRVFATTFLAGSAALFIARTASSTATHAVPDGHAAFPAHYRVVDIDGVSVFYREAGRPGAPVVLLLHGWPSSSAMFRDLIRELSVNYHVFAPDYPGFGNSDVPDPVRFRYTFDNLGEVIGKFVDKVGIRQYALYATDFGGLVGYRLMMNSPKRMKALIAQNNPLFFSDSPWFGALAPYWKDGSPASRQSAAEHYLSRAVVRDLYVAGVLDPSLVDPEQWQSEYMLLQRPGAAEASLDLLYDIRTNGPVLKGAQDYLRVHQPPTLVVSGKNDVLFSAQNQLRYREVLPNAEIHLTDSGHCALADKSAEIGARSHAFLSNAL